MKNSKKSSVMITVGFCLALAFLSVSFFLIPDVSFSENENRNLEMLPGFSLSSLVDGEYTGKMSDYCSDQFPFRRFFLNIRAESELLLGKKESNGIIKGRNGDLIADPGTPDREAVLENLSFFEALSEKYGREVYLAFAPQSAYILSSSLPGCFPMESLCGIRELISDSVSENCVSVDIAGAIKAHSDEKVYYSTDHHWTSLGAYYAYAQLVTALGDEPYPLGDFDITEVSDDFYGTSWSFGGFPFINPDTVEFFCYDGDEDLTVYVDCKEAHKGLYDYAYLGKKDKYSAFVTSTTNGFVEIVKDGEKRQTLILIKDSFAHSIAPMLARHYDIVMIDTRYCTLKKGGFAEIIDRYDVKAIVALMGENGLNDSSYQLYKLLDF